MRISALNSFQTHDTDALKSRYGFTQTWAFEPFLKMHRTSNMTAEEIQAQADAKWTKFNDETVLMRTASFGKSTQNEDVSWTRII